MAVLITGGLGHVGSWVAQMLASQGKKVIICDMAAKHFDSLGLDYLEAVRDKLVLEAVDVLDYHTLFETLLTYRDELEGVIHGVSVIAGPSFQQRPFRNISVNTLGTLNVYETCRILGIDKIVNMSSGAVYGDASGPQQETTPYKATDLYGATKISGELFGDQYTDTYGMDIRHARLFFVYGPGKRPSHMHQVYQALFGPLEGLRDVQAPNGRDQALDWTHVHDTAKGIVLLFEKASVQARHFNISSGVTIDHQAIVDEVEQLLGKSSNMQLGPGPFVVRGSPLDITLAQDELGFQPVYVDIKKGLQDYWQWLSH
ncbi:NAD(P)-dependent oxidoreductase [Halomonas sp. McH1-25]|uniref:NAD-dependent epimerase/dehydratase family protein n=1 Tax=unclassified Halomonas TaxID=2609666 RepID=UPI001EF4E99C|nr:MULTISPECIES: NAD(P)-dependent oxidoreductase [unclassified Halomonas]MCG7599819.1 NAD(P)-dependent oxidoreductase [Halomonas sp. McH1-25]MCP1341714.1 NAD(P)-dependent oxidoreductase [Halomonas sp. FL8]MCP1359872.1 NAD(P)-dependent oxidoreductase [Halomonas sp. BBD45]MCP1364300.1 NAD(P)-dependent oxidoreductase [Halomonas sp. BBD48]